jgi:S-DNA-T family DNA segregation ATPase FtsK/SpoIIIE
MFALGKDLVGNPILDDLSKGPHYLVAGATGSGKSVCLNLMIVSLIMRYSPEDLRLILVDPKGVEFINYEHIPHLMIDEIITEPKKALSVLSWAYTEMERRFSVFRESGGGLVVDIDSYNQVVASDTVAKMPRIVIIIDELADLMETCKKDLESRIRAIAQKARAAGIHLVLATQRPSVDIITGTIKANLPSRIAFKVMNFNDSQTIVSEAGAEKLLGNGDMLYKTARMSSTERYQGAYISSREVNSIVSYIKEKNTAYFDDELKEFLDKESRPKQEDSYGESDGGDDANEVNEFFLKALWLAVNTETVSISQLQRRFQIGYSRAGGLVDKMERMGFVSPNEGSKARRVLLTREQFEERFGSMPD